jgi:hypothetical protein
MGADVMPNGKVLLSSVWSGGGPNYTNLWEYDPNAASSPFTEVPLPPWSASDHTGEFLQLPTGQVLFLDQAFPSVVNLYNPATPFVVAGAPTITSLSASTSLGALTLTGTGINGQTIGATYGDDFNSGTAYPLVYLQDSANHKYYARTFNFSTMAPAPGAGSCELVLPSTLPDGTTPIPKGTYTVHLNASGVEAAGPLPSIQLGTAMTAPWGLMGGNPPDAVDPGVNVRWWVSLDGAAPPGGIVVDLSALKALDANGQRTVDVVTLPPSVTVLEGRKIAPFIITAVQTGYTKIYGTARSNVAQTAVRDFGTQLTSLTGPQLPPTGNSLSLTLKYVWPLPYNGITVNLTSSDPQVATFDNSTDGTSTLFIPGSAGSTATVTVNIVGPGPATITASLPGSSVSAPVGFRVLGLTGPVVPTSGNTATWTVTIDSSIANGQSPVTVNLSSSAPSRASVPASVPVTSGNSADFTVMQGTDLNQATITASAGRSQTFAFFGYILKAVHLSNSQISVSGMPNTTDVTWILNAPAPSQGLVLPVMVDDSNSSPSNFVTAPPTVTVPGGMSTFSVTATAANPGTGFVTTPILPYVQAITVVP